MSSIVMKNKRGGGTLERIKKTHPKRFRNCGVNQTWARFDKISVYLIYIISVIFILTWIRYYFSFYPQSRHFKQSCPELSMKHTVRP